MRSTITISLPDPVRKELDRMSQDEGVSRSDIVRESIRDLFFVRGRGRRLRGFQDSDGPQEPESRLEYASAGPTAENLRERRRSHRDFCIPGRQAQAHLLVQSA